MFRKRRAPSMEELQALEEMDQKSKPIRRNELIDESEQQPSQIEEEETEDTEQEEKKKDRKQHEKRIVKIVMFKRFHLTPPERYYFQYTMREKTGQ